MIQRILFLSVFCFLVVAPVVRAANPAQPTSSADVFAPETVRGWVATYFQGTRSMDAHVWASAFSADAVLDDPVGTPLKKTPAAILAQGEAFVGAFATIGLYEDFVHVVGNEAVAKWVGRGVTKDGVEVEFEGINHFTFNAEGKVVRLRGFFTPPGA